MLLLARTRQGPKLCPRPRLPIITFTVPLYDASRSSALQAAKMTAGALDMQVRGALPNRTAAPQHDRRPPAPCAPPCAPTPQTRTKAVAGSCQPLARGAYAARAPPPAPSPPPLRRGRPCAHGPGPRPRRDSGAPPLAPSSPPLRPLPTPYCHAFPLRAMALGCAQGAARQPPPPSPAGGRLAAAVSGAGAPCRAKPPHNPPPSPSPSPHLRPPLLYHVTLHLMCVTQRHPRVTRVTRAGRRPPRGRAAVRGRLPDAL